MARRMTHTGAVPSDLTPTVTTNREQRHTIFMAAALLLDYPDEGFSEKAQAVAAQVDDLPPTIGQEFLEFLQAAQHLGERGLQTHYVDTFDQRRRCSLYLSYYAVGDTRQRGTALVSFGEHLKQLGFELNRDELPDHLCVMLEAAALARGDAHEAAVELLAAHRDGIEVLRTALEQAESPYAHLVRAVCMALPQVDQETADRYFTLITTGPPAEMVGLETTPLPFPTVTGSSS